MARSTRLSVAVVITVLLAPASTSAQELTESTSESLRITCSRAAERVKSGPSDPSYARGIGQLGGCGETGPPLLVELWREPPVDSLVMERLIDATGSLRDRRLLDAVERAATDPARPVDVRLSALRVLAQYFNPHVHLDSDVLPPPPYSENYRWSSIDHPGVTEGAEPLPTSTQEEVLEILTRLAESDPDPIVRRSAEYLVEQLRWYSDR